MGTQQTSLYKIQARNGFWKIDRTLARYFRCLHTVMVLDELIFHESKHADQNGWFFYQVERLEDVCMIGEKMRIRCFKNLVESGILEIERRGLPCRNWYRINDQAIDEIIRKMGDELDQTKDTTPPRGQVHSDPLEEETVIQPEGASYNNNIFNKKKITKKVFPYSQTSKEVDSRDLNSRIWDAYSKEYEKRYKYPPKRNARVNAQIMHLGKALGEDAIEVCKFYVHHNDSYFIKNSHVIGILLAKAEALYTQWLQRKPITNKDARTLEQMSSLFDIDSAIANGEI